mgnify:CR=1 FL=1|tara:strand:- start:618 stop:1043 length:426 start_codon:yes stop_codon:yes gene_type:complete
MSDYRELINEAIKLGTRRLVEEETAPIENLEDGTSSDVISVSKQLTDAFDNFLDLLASSISDLEDVATADPEGMDYIIDLTTRGQKMETAFSRLKEVLLKAPSKLGGPVADPSTEVAVPIEPEPETVRKAGFGSVEDVEEI